MLVDERFGGTWDDLRAARAATTAPLLAKGFFSTDEHLRTAKEAGADAVLLLLRDLDDGETARLMDVAESLGLDTLVEAHDAAELERGIALRARVLGVNARDLATFSIDRKAQLELVARIPADRIVIAESGIQTRAQGAAAELAGADAVLVGSTLMRAPDPGAKLAELLSRPARQGVRADARGGRCGRRRGGRRPRRVHPRAREPACRDGRPAGAGRDAVGRGLGRRGRATPAPISTRCTPSRRARCAAARRRFSATARRWRGCSTCPWEGTDPDHWRAAAEAEGRIVLAGKLGPDNVRAAIAAVQPWAVDAASSLESAPGIKDHDKVRRYVEAARS